MDPETATELLGKVQEDRQAIQVTTDIRMTETQDEHWDARYKRVKALQIMVTQK